MTDLSKVCFCCLPTLVDRNDKSSKHSQNANERILFLDVRQHSPADETEVLVLGG